MVALMTSRRGALTATRDGASWQRAGGKRNHDELAEEIHQNRQRHVKFRISVRFTWALGATIWNGLWLAFHDEAPPLPLFVTGLTSSNVHLTDDLREGRPSTATTETTSVLYASWH
ncbi:hypothetical protein EVAR_20584_1 [Eumeta japonica]|uniref:Uncharacterized protein n=1 Tax=Eumeta variegata TaxID=151549 RepID=A0A4C1URY2_EUMVA|nr:hypothetical protein EVAR_20584_1 [Eumeta japonica]